MDARRHWDEIFKVLKDKDCQQRNLYTEKPSFKKEVKTFPEKQTDSLPAT